jgi:anionic cell wall polymer biosynthesis LytR-Cps2A-Psr (LCP) family protein
MSGIENTLGVPCEFYVKFDRASFTSFTALLGDVLVNVAAGFSARGLTLTAGEHFMPGSDLFLYMSFVSEDCHLAVSGRAITMLINSNLRNMDEASISGTFNRVLNNADTNLSFRDFITYHMALYYTSTTDSNPAMLYIPTSERVAHEFVISPQSLANIHERFGLTTS